MPSIPVAERQRCCGWAPEFMPAIDAVDAAKPSGAAPLLTEFGAGPATPVSVLLDLLIGAFRVAATMSSIRMRRTSGVIAEH